jgi:putative membrane protein
VPHLTAPLLAAAANTSFSLAPGPILIVLVLVGLYVTRWRRVRATGNPRGAEWSRLAAWLGGVLCIAVALISPVDTLADQVFFMHMIQHVLLLDFAPILLIVGLTKVLLRPVARQVLDLERALGPVANPVFAIFLYVGFMWAWHIPTLYDAALEHPFVHGVEHATFFTAGTLVWWPLIQPVPMRYRLTGIGAFGYTLGAKISLGVLGLYLTWSKSVAFDYYNHVPEIWGLSHLQDQNVGGALMMVEQAIVLVIVESILFVKMLNASEEAELRRERLEDAAEERERLAALEDVAPAS